MCKPPKFFFRLALFIYVCNFECPLFITFDLYDYHKFQALCLGVCCFPINFNWLSGSVTIQRKIYVESCLVQ